MVNIALAVQKAKEKLAAEKQIHIEKITHVQTRCFSEIYEFSSQKKSFIVKVYKKKNQCKKEYCFYEYLQKKNIRCLIPVIFCETHNYLITEKENIVSFETILNTKSPAECARYLSVFATSLAELNKLTGEYSLFDSSKYKSYVFHRIKKHRFLNSKQQKSFTTKLDEMIDKMRGKKVWISLVSDFNFCNIFFDQDDQVVFLDLADAEFANHYKNFALLYLNIRIHSKKKDVSLYRNSFLHCYSAKNLDHLQIKLYTVLHLVNMICFCVIQKRNTWNLPRILSNKFDIFRYKKLLFEILKNERVHF